MNRIFFLVLLINLTNTIFSQEIVTWDVRFNKQENQIELNATIEKGWHLYSQYIENNVGPVPTSFTFKSSNDFQLVGQVNEPKAIQKYDGNFEATLDFFEKQVTFNQKIKPFNTTHLEGTITYMVCNESMCLPPVDYKYKLEINL